MTKAELTAALFRGEKGLLHAQVPEESLALCEILLRKPFKKVLEVGSGLASTPIWEFLLEGEGLIVSVDINEVAIERVRPFVDPKLVKFVEGDAASEETFEKIKQYFDLGTVDFLFIDGEHAYDWVKADYERNSPFVRRGGIIAFHDMWMDGPSRVVQEAKERGLVTDTDSIPGGLGIGLIYV